MGPDASNMMHRLGVLIGFCALLLISMPVFAQPLIPETEHIESQEIIEPIGSDPLGRDTPRGLVSGLIAELAKRDFQNAARYLQTKDADRAAIARRFKQALDRNGAFISVGELSDEPAGDATDEVDPDREMIGTLKISDDGVANPIIAIRTTRNDLRVWLISDDTLDRLEPQTVQNRDANEAADMLDELPDQPLLSGVPLAQWIVLGAFAIASTLLAWIATRIRLLSARWVGRRENGTQILRFVEASEPPMRLFLATIIFELGIDQIGVSIVARYKVDWMVQFAWWFAAGWLLWRLTDAIAQAALTRMSNRGQLTAFSTISFATRIAKGLIAAVFVIFCLRALGVDVTAGLAALGVGGLAIALGAQKLFENLIGSLTLIADRPVKIGDFGRFGDKTGTIEQIGIRSTRVRTLDRTVVTIPNGEFSAMQLENYTQRDRFLFKHVLGLRYETTPAQIETTITALTDILSKNEDVDPEPGRVRLVHLASHSIDLEIFAYVVCADYEAFLAIQQQLILRIMNAVAENGPGFAFPSQMLYLAEQS